MALDRLDERQETAERRQETAAPTTLEKLRNFAETKARVLAVIAAMSTPITIAACDQKQETTVESTAEIRLSLQPVMIAPKGFVGVEIYSTLNEPLQDTHIELIDAEGNSIYSQEHQIAQGRNAISFIETEYSGNQDIAFDDADKIRTVVVSGRDLRGNLIQQEISIPPFAFDE